MRIFILWVLLFSGCFSAVAQTESVITPISRLYDEQQSAPLEQPGCILMTEKDSLVVKQILDKYNLTHPFSAGDLIIDIAGEFLGTPYVAGTLDTQDKECLTVNVLEMDCTTFVEYVLALTLSVKDKNSDVNSLIKHLQKFRYRFGEPEKYPSRLHYFSDWLYTNQEKGLIDLISDELGTEEFDTHVHFMSENPEYYHQLSDRAFLHEMRKQEKIISERSMKYLPKNRIDEHAQFIANGDIIAFTSTIDGLDVSHTVFACHLDNKLHFIHASVSGKKVEISPIPLQQYLMNLNSVDGILIGRLKD
ncbi:MAG: N-acetylmuramoyl-L-alanine amidase-like domain-containing protein [Bacteroidota bacterium]